MMIRQEFGKCGCGVYPGIGVETGISRKPCQDSRYPDRDSNRALFGNKSLHINLLAGGGLVYLFIYYGSFYNHVSSSDYIVSDNRLISE
jgi:hypothetical protein